MGEQNARFAPSGYAIEKGIDEPRMFFAKFVGQRINARRIKILRV